MSCINIHISLGSFTDLHDLAVVDVAAVGRVTVVETGGHLLQPARVLYVGDWLWQLLYTERTRQDVS